ncbi:uncharacterized, partial [Tachysurus ichikawai]
METDKYEPTDEACDPTAPPCQ